MFWWANLQEMSLPVLYSSGIGIARMQEPNPSEVLHNIHHPLFVPTSQPSEIALELIPKRNIIAVRYLYNCCRSYLFLLQSLFTTVRRLASIPYQFLCHISTIKANNLCHIAVLLIAKHTLANAQAAHGS